MEECKVRKLVDEAVDTGSTELEAIEIDGGESNGALIVWWVITVEALVGAYIRANPGLSDA